MDVRREIGILAALAVVGSLLSAIAGTLKWWEVWLYLLIMLEYTVLITKALHRSPGLREERRTAAARAPKWDRVASPLIGPAGLITIVVAAIEHRTCWLPAVPIAVSIIALGLLVPVPILVYRSIAANAFFSSHVRIQADRGHVVVSTGPYRFLRHPAYAGWVVLILLTPAALGSWLALVPAGCAAALVAWRTAMEDRFLLSNLPGYSEYAVRVPHRLIPGVW